MLTVNIYRWRDDMHSVEDTKRIMEAFGKRGSGPDEVAHYEQRVAGLAPPMVLAWLHR